MGGGSIASTPSSDDVQQNNFICGVVEGSFTSVPVLPSLVIKTRYRLLWTTMDNGSKKGAFQETERIRTKYVHVRTEG